MPPERLLIVDDDQNIRELLGSIALHLGYPFEIAADGREALARLAAGEFHIVISDINMPQMSGLKLLAAVQENYPSLPFILVTGENDCCYTDVIAAGAVDFIRKPIILEELAAKLDRVIREKKLIAALSAEIAQRKQAEKEIRRHYKIQVILNKLFRLMLSSVSLSSTLEKFINYITSLPDLSLLPKGAIFLVNEDGRSLDLIAHKSLAPELRVQCLNVPFGHCLCGRAAVSGETVFVDHIDERHDTLYDAIAPHGHYCIPIKNSAGNLIGVFTVYTAAGCLQDPRIEEILKAAASVASVVIEREKAHAVQAELFDHLRRAQKMESIGTLAGGIAHDFNNILTAILGFATLAGDALEKENPISEDIDQIILAGRRAKELVQQILTFSRQVEQERVPVQLGYIVKETLKLLRASLPATISIRQYVDMNCGMILADSTQMHQVLMNLFTNAFHAMRGAGGILTVSLENVEIKADGPAVTPPLAAGKYIMLTVADTGTGISPEILNRIFDPYFSTKLPGEGTGLGLSVVHGIVESHGGIITAESSLGGGSTFRIYLSAHEDNHDKGEVQAPDIPGGEEHILFVDDELAIVKMTKRLLEKLGYTVTARTSSIEALEAFRAAPDKFDLLISDQTMPNMTGIELVHRIKLLRPDLPALLCTGFSGILWSDDPRDLGVAKVLLKPLELGQLGTAIREVFDAQTQS